MFDYDQRTWVTNIYQINLHCLLRTRFEASVARWCDYVTSIQPVKCRLSERYWWRPSHTQTGNYPRVRDGRMCRSEILIDIISILNGGSGNMINTENPLPGGSNIDGAFECCDYATPIGGAFEGPYFDIQRWRF